MTALIAGPGRRLNMREAPPADLRAVLSTGTVQHRNGSGNPSVTPVSTTSHSPAVD